MEYLITHGLTRSKGDCKKNGSKRAKLDAVAAMPEDTKASITKKVNGTF